jgi:hypothetical protein
MKAAVGYLCIAALLGTAGVSVWAVGERQRQTVAAQERLFTFEYAAAARDPDALTRWADLLQRLPLVGVAGNRAEEQRAASRYWLGEYRALADTVATPDAASALDPAVLMIAAQAAYRHTPLDDGVPEAVKRLTAIVELYAEILKRDPLQVDAAFNFEFIARKRNALAAGRGVSSNRRDPAPAAPLPRPGRTLHGDRGAVPPGLEESELKVIIPKQSDERQEEREAGSSAPKVRKG